jgi:predicted dehydrogenase
MPNRDSSRPATHASRRTFLKSSTAAAGVAALGTLGIARSAHAAGSGTLKVGLIGCGGRGSGAAANAMNAGESANGLVKGGARGGDVKLVAMGDIFADRLEGALGRLKKMKPEQVDVPPERQFIGFDAYQKVIASGVDVVIIAGASHFHPQHLKAAVAAGKHVFCEKPHGLDVPALKSAMASAEEARRKGLSLVSGLCWRYDQGVRETMQRVQDGDIGEIVEAGMERDGVPDAELVPLQLALRRPDRPAVDP